MQIDKDTLTTAEDNVPAAKLRSRFSLPKIPLWSWLALVVLLLAGGGFLFFNLFFNSKAPDPIYIAMAAPLTGSNSLQGHEIVNTVQLVFDGVNQSGGVDGHPLKILTFDDAGDPKVAKQRAQEIVTSPAVVVFGHATSTTSLAAAPIYRDAHLPALTANNTLVDITRDNPYYFRATYDLENQSDALSLYIRKVLGYNNVSLIIPPPAPNATAAPVGLEVSFKRDGGNLKHIWYYDANATADKRKATLDQIAKDLQADSDPGIVYLGISPSTASRDIVVDLRRRGLTPRFFGSSGLGNDAFAKLFSNLDEERFQPGYFTDGMYAAAPVVLDSTGKQAQGFLGDYQNTYKEQPDAVALQYYAAAQVFVDSLRRGNLSTDAANLNQNRQQVRDQLASYNRAEVAFPSALGPLFFNKQNTWTEPIKVGQFKTSHFISASDQLTTLVNPALVNLEREQAAGNVFKLGEEYLWRQRVVYAGIDFNKVSRIDQTKGTFTADFYLWFRYSGADDVTQVAFPDLVDTKSFDPKNTIEAKKVDNVNYRAYRIQGDFKTSFDYHEYPFDMQQLTLRFQHPLLTRERAVYVIDTLGLGQQSLATSGAFEGLSSWTLRNARFSQDTTRSSSTRGDPEAFSTSNVTEYPSFQVIVTIQRKTLVYLVKALLPLGLLVLVVYITLHFPITLTKERLTIATSSLLASAVLLTGINSQLSEATYTTAAEYGFYVFFGLCLLCVLVTLIGERFHNAKRTKEARRFDILARFGYILIVVVTITIYVLLFGQRFG